MAPKTTGTGNTTPGQRTTGNTPAAPSVTAQSVDIRVTQTNQTLQELANRYYEDIAEVANRLGGNDRHNKSVDARHRRLVALVDTIGERLADTHDTLVADAMPRLAKLEGLVASGMTLRLAMRITKFTTDEVKAILRIQSESGEFTDDEIMNGVVDGLGRLQAQYGALEEHFATLSGRVDDLDGPGGAIDMLDGRMTGVEGAVKGLKKEVTDLKESLKMSPWTLGLALLAGIGAFFTYIGTQKAVTVVPTYDKLGGKQTGVAPVDAQIFVHASLWAVGIFAIVMVISTFFKRRTPKSHKQAPTVASSTTSTPTSVPAATTAVHPATPDTASAPVRSSVRS